MFLSRRGRRSRCLYVQRMRSRGTSLPWLYLGRGSQVSRQGLEVRCLVRSLAVASSPVGRLCRPPSLISRKRQPPTQASVQLSIKFPQHPDFLPQGTVLLRHPPRGDLHLLRDFDALKLVATHFQLQLVDVRLPPSTGRPLVERVALRHRRRGGTWGRGL